MVKPALSRNAILEAHARHESMQQRFTPAKTYRELLGIVDKRFADEWRVTVSWDDCLAYGNFVGDWPAFPDSAASLQYLKQHYKLVILSNVDNASLALTSIQSSKPLPSSRLTCEKLHGEPSRQ